MLSDEQQGVEEASKLVDGQCDQAGRCGLGVAFGRGGHGQEGMRKHGQGGPAVPRGPAPDLMLIDTDEACGGLEGFLDSPALASHGNQGLRGGRAR